MTPSKSRYGVESGVFFTALTPGRRRLAAAGQKGVEVLAPRDPLIANFASRQMPAFEQVESLPRRAVDFGGDCNRAPDVGRRWLRRFLGFH